MKLMATSIKTRFPPFLFMLGFIVFAALCANIWMVIRSTLVKADVVRVDYYAQGLKHDILLDAQRRLDSLGFLVALHIQDENISVKWDRTDTSAFPPDFLTRLQCIAQIYRPDNSHLDQSISLVRDSLMPIQWLGMPQPLAPGRWKVSVRWYLDTLLFLEKPFKYSS
jgi:hypothetical protein